MVWRGVGRCSAWHLGGTCFEEGPASFQTASRRRGTCVPYVENAGENVYQPVDGAITPVKSPSAPTPTAHSSSSSTAPTTAVQGPRSGSDSDGVEPTSACASHHTSPSSVPLPRPDHRRIYRGYATNPQVRRDLPNSPWQAWPGVSPGSTPHSGRGHWPTPSAGASGSPVPVGSDSPPQCTRIVNAR